MEQKIIEEIKIKCQELSEEQIRKLIRYMELMLEWNEKINLTAITDPSDIILKHFIDSLTILKYIPNGSIVADVGTGAGFPGIPVKIAREDIKIVLVDSLNKRINFLNEVVNNLNLEDVQTIHSRAEELGQNKQYREGFDVATSRAVAPLGVLAEYLLPLVKVGGKCICMKGPEIDTEIEKSRNAIKVLGGEIERVEEFNLPGSDIKRSIITIVKTQKTPRKYPRKAGTPSKEPL